jgi:ferrochelatase
MRLENILALTRGTLYSTPTIHVFEGVIFEVSKVKRGSLFIASTPCDIPEALKNGAYGILFDKPTQIGDPEVAWIKVDALDIALKRILRFYLLEKELRVYACDPLTLHLSHHIATPKQCYSLEGSIQKVWDKLWSLEKKSFVLFSPTLSDSDLFIDATPLSSFVESTLTVIEKTLFETAFVYQDIFYERRMLSPFFIPYLEPLLHFYHHMEIPFHLKNFTKMNHFTPIFTNRHLEMKEFGSSDRVVIFESFIEVIEEEIAFLEENAKWSQKLYILPSSCGISRENCLYYESVEEILPLLKVHSFHFALVAGVSKKLVFATTSRVSSQLEFTF